MPIDHRARESSPAGPADEAWTVGRLLTWTTDYLKRRGSESPRLDAEVMLAQVLEWQRVQLYTHFTDEVPSRPRGRFRDLVRRRVRRVAGGLPRRPQGVLLAGVRGLAGRADPPARVGVRGRRVPGGRPRRSNRPAPSTSAPARAAWRSPRRTGTARLGSSRSTSAKRPWRSPARTPATHGVADRIDFRLGDRLEPVAGEGPFDVIVSNPPYIPTGVDRQLEAGVRDYEPQPALDGGPAASTWSRA